MMTGLPGVVVLAALTSSTSATRRNESTEVRFLDARETALRGEARLETIIELALERSPVLKESRHRFAAARQGAEAASRLPDLELKVEQWGVPLRRPWGLDEADTLMLGLRQSFPAMGSLGARARARLAETQSKGESANARALDLTQDARRAYGEYYRADQEHRVHLEHVELAAEVLSLTRSRYQAGRGDQVDLLRASVGLARLHQSIAAIEQARLSAGAILNTIMDRAPDASLGPPRDLPAFAEVPETIDLAALEAEAGASRPEVKAAEADVKRAEAELLVAQASASWPSITAGIDYWFMPMSDIHHAYGAMLAINLPWLNPRNAEEVREAELGLAADRSRAKSVKNTSRFELFDHAARCRAQKRTREIIDQRLVPEAEKTFEAARASFASGQGSALGVLDALGMLLDARLESVRAGVDLFRSLADLDRALGRGEVAVHE